MSENKKGKKRPKSYYRKCAAQGGKKFKFAMNDLAAGMKGFLVTCNKYERETVREMYNILNEYADQMYGPEVKLDDREADDADSESEEEDMEKAMAKETSAIKKAASSERRFQNTDSKTKNCVFIRTTVESPCDLAHKIFTDIVESQVQKARYALRMLPISVTCKANVNNIKEAAEPMLKPHFETEFGVGLKYTTVCKIRNNQSVSRTSILPTLGRIVHELNPLHKLCHDEPDLVIIVEVIRNVCCMSVVKDYFTFRKYNFHEVLKKKDSNDKDTAKTDDTPDDVKENKENTESSMVVDCETETNQSECEKDTITENKDDIKSVENESGNTNTADIVDNPVVQETDKISECDKDDNSKKAESEKTQTETDAIVVSTENVKTDEIDVYTENVENIISKDNQKDSVEGLDEKSIEPECKKLDSEETETKAINDNIVAVDDKTETKSPEIEED